MVNNEGGLCVEFLLDLFNIIGFGCHSLDEIDLVLFFHLSDASDKFLYLIDCESVGPKNPFLYW